MYWKQNKLLFLHANIYFTQISSYDEQGLEAIVFTADGDMRQALNNIQATFAGFKFISAENVFKVTLFIWFHYPFIKVCDQPHPLVLKAIIDKTMEANIEEANSLLMSLWKDGYSASDIISTLFKVVKNHNMEEYLKLEYLKVVLS